MISLLCNVPQFHNDISEEIRLFLGLTDICFSEDPSADMTMKLTLGNKEAVCELFPYNVKSVVPYESSIESLEKKRREKRAVKLAAYKTLQQVFSTSTPWGSLTGIRPTKLYREIAFRQNEEEADKQFTDVFSVSSEKLHLVKKIHEVQAPVIRSASSKDLDIYIGIPYCKTRCIYCSFGSEVVKKNGQLKEYLNSLKDEIMGSSKIVDSCGYSVRCSYFGGGTPTVLDADMLDDILSFTEDIYGGFGKEFTVEAGRPDTITDSKLKILKKHGVSRISVNPQTMNESTLKVIGRSHSPESIINCFSLARDLGFDNINMDVIAGLPGESIDDFKHTLDEIVSLCPESLTVHTLALKKSSLLIEKLAQYPLPDAVETERMVAIGADYAKGLGMVPYYMYRQKYMSGNLENVGYCLPGKECVYNIDMMEETVSVMAHGAHTISKRVFSAENRVERVANPKDVPTYFSKIPTVIDNKKAVFSLTSC